MESNNENPPYSTEEKEEEEEEEDVVGDDNDDIEEEDLDAVDVDESASDAELSDADAASDAELGEGDEEGIVSKKKKGDKVTETKKRGLKVIDGLDKLATALPIKKTTDEYMEHNDYDDDDDDDDGDDDMNYLQKFDNSLRENFILNHHPEIKSHNYEEVKALTHISRDGRGIIIDPLHKTVPFLTKYEMTRVIGQRAKQLDSGAKAFVKIPLNVIEGYHIAMLELEQKKMPFIIKRPYPNGGVEYWNVNDLEVL